MPSISPIAVGITLFAIGLSLYGRDVRKDDSWLGSLSSGMRLLIAFLGLVGLYLVLAVVRYWPAIRGAEDLIYYGIALFLAMVFGMFVRVMASNRQAGRDYFAVTAPDLHLSASVLTYRLLSDLGARCRCATRSFPDPRCLSEWLFLGEHRIRGADPSE